MKYTVYPETFLSITYTSLKHSYEYNFYSNKRNQFFMFKILHGNLNQRKLTFCIGPNFNETLKKKFSGRIEIFTTNTSSQSHQDIIYIIHK